jgi:hypothetical protein
MNGAPMALTVASMGRLDLIRKLDAPETTTRLAS